MKQSFLRAAVPGLFAFLFPLLLPALGGKEGKRPDVVPNTVVVRLKPGAVTLGKAAAVLGAPEVYTERRILQDEQSVAAGTALRKRMGTLSATRIEAMVRAEEPLLRTFVLKYAGSEDPYSYAERLMRTNPQVEVAEPSYIPRLHAPPNDPMLGQQEMLNVIKALEAWEVYDGDETMVIGVSDDGVNQQHEDLAGSLWINTGEIPNNNIDDDDNGYIDDYNGYNFAAQDDSRPYGNTYNTRQHGTSVAGILGATMNNGVGMSGIAGKCKIFPLKIAPFGTQSLDYGYESIIYAAVNGFKVLNCSWGIDVYSDINQSVINFALSRDVAIVAGGGNDGDSRLVFPAAYHGVMGVANSWPDDYLWSGSAYGAHVDITAPGEGAMSTANSGYIPFGGTSGAAPIVAGALALVRAKYPSLNAPQAMEFLRNCTDDISAKNQDKPGMVPGRLNLLRAMTRNPFDQPGVALESYALKNTAGQSVNRFSVGEEITLSLVLKNHLGASPGVICSLSVLQDAQASLDVVVSEVTTPAMASGQTILVEDLKVKKVGDNVSTVFLRVDIAGDNGYTAFFLVPFRPSVGFSIFSNDSLEFGMTDGGQVGFEERFTSPDERGFHLRSFGNLLYEGGFMACEGGTRVVSATRSHLYDGINQTTEVDRDFSTVKPFEEPGRETGVIRDDLAATPVGLEVRQQVRIPATASRITAVDVTVKNISGGTLQDVAAGYFFDWDIGRYGENNTMDLAFSGVSPLGVPTAWGVATRPGSEYAAVGCGAYSSFPGAVPQFAEFENYSSAAANPLTTGLGFAQSDKIRTLTSGTTLSYGGSGDVGCVTGMLFPGAWPNGEERTFTLLIGAAWTEVELQQALDAYWATVAVGEPEPGSYAADVRVYPQPAHDLVHITGPGSGRATVTVLSTVGVAALPPVVVAADSGTFHAQLNMSSLAAGVYMVRIDSGGQTTTVPVVLVK